MEETKELIERMLEKLKKFQLHFELIELSFTNTKLFEIIQPSQMQP
jgi:hypothetical protein